MKRHDFDKDTYLGIKHTILIPEPHTDEWHHEIAVCEPSTKKEGLLGIFTSRQEPCWLTREECKQLINVIQEYMGDENGDT